VTAARFVQRLDMTMYSVFCILRRGRPMRPARTQNTEYRIQNTEYIVMPRSAVTQGAASGPRRRQLQL
jgi:hypothetical protein